MAKSIVLDEERLREEVIDMLVKTRDLIEEVLETIDVLADEELIEAIKESEDGIEKGDARDFREFAEALNLEGEL